MRAEFNAIDVGCGDCLFLILENNDRSFHIMIDCENYDKAKDYIVNRLHNKIDLLTVLCRCLYYNVKTTIFIALKCH